MAQNVTGFRPGVKDSGPKGGVTLVTVRNGERNAEIPCSD